MTPEIPKQAIPLLKDFTKTGIQKLTALVKDVQAENRFDDWLQGEQNAWVNKIGKQELAIATADIKAVFQLARAAAGVYTHDHDFTTIGLIPDRDGTFGRLPMADYFIDLAFMTREETTTKETLLTSETEMNKVKIHRSLHNNTHLGKEYISHYDFDKITNLLIVGSPGVGKTTFVKWLCNYWGEQPSRLACVPVYINLRWLSFSSSDNAIIRYIIERYMPTAQAAGLLDMIRRMHQHVLFILDGYDELSEDNKQALTKALTGITSNCRYILTSRPYGILENYGLNWTQSFQINGFSEQHINLYIERFVGKKREDLMDIIRLNPTLTDFAHNPLMLSFMVFIYLADEDGGNMLRQVESRFALNENVIQWSQQYHKGKQIPEALYSMCEALAYDLEMKKEFSMVLPKDTPLRFFAEIGLAAITGKDVNHVIFNFTSITFQEYFAAKYLSRRITIAAFNYLVQDSFYWNLAAMLIGHLNGTGALDELIDAFEKEDESRHRNYTFYKYLLMLSECNSGYINSKLDTGRLGILFSRLMNHIADERLKFGLADCFKRIYMKLSKAGRQQIKTALIGELAQIWEADQADILSEWNQKSTGIIEQIKFLELLHDAGFIKQLIDLLRQVLQEMSQGLRSQESFVTVPSYAIEFLRSMNREYIDIYAAAIQELIELLPAEMAYDRASLRSHYLQATEVIENLSSSVVNYQHTVASGSLLAIHVFEAGSKAVTIQQDYELLEQAEKLLLKAMALLQEDQWLESVPEGDEEGIFLAPSEVLRLVTEGLLQFDHTSGLFRCGLELIYASEENFWEIEAEKINLIKIYLDYYAGTTSTLPLEDRIVRLSRLFSQVAAIRIYLPLYRDRLLAFVNEYVNLHHSILSDPAVYAYAVNGTIDDDIMPWEPVLEVLYPFHQLLLDENTYTSDKGYIVDCMLRDRFQEIAYYRYIVFPELLRSHYNFSDVSWEYLFEALSGSLHAKEAVFQILQNESLFRYGGHIKKIKELLTLIISWNREPWFTELMERCVQDVLLLVAESLYMVRSMTVAARTTEPIIAVCGQLLLDKTMLAFVSNSDLSALHGRTMTAYLLQYIFTGDERFNTGPDLSQLFDEQKEEVLQTLYDLFARKGKLDEDNIALKIYLKEELKEYMRDQQVFNFPFDTKKMDALLLSSPH